MTGNRKEEGRSIGDLDQDYLDNPRPILVKVEEGAIVFTENGSSIDQRQIPDHEAIVGWINQLMTKNWITIEHLKQMITEVCLHNNLNSHNTH